MRGGGDQFSVGERVAFYRQRRGLTQRVLAELVGRSEDWLSKIERGDRDLRRLDIVAALATALRVTVGDLLGQPVLVEDDDDHDDVPAIRAALMNHRRLSPLLFDPQPAGHRTTDARAVSTAVSAVRANYEEGRLGRVIAALPALIGQAQALEDQHDDGRDGFAVSARIHHLTASTLTKVGEADLAWMAAERGMAAAEKAGDPLIVAAVARSATGALLAIGRFDDALEVGTRAVRWVQQQLGPDSRDDPVALSLTGMLYLRSAEAAAQSQNRQTTTELLRQASTAADRLGRDANYWQTNFGPTNVALHRVAIGLDLDDIPTVLEFGPQIDPSVISAERAATYRIDMARAYSAIAADTEAVEYLLAAERDAAQLVWHSALAREAVRSLYRRMTRSRSDVIELAERCRAVV